MKLGLIVFLVSLLFGCTDAFTSSPSIGQRTALISSRKATAIRAAAADEAPKKKTAKKKKAVKAAAKEEVETFRKPEFVASIAEKTGMSKVDSEAALAAVLETITEASIDILIFPYRNLHFFLQQIFFVINRMLQLERRFLC